MRRTGLLLTSLAFAAIINASCPNKCSGHGTCGSSDVCSCQAQWMGGDCSERECPYVRAWSDTAQFNSDAHYYAECGNRGTCDRSTGQCTCDAGFTGKGCRRMACPNDCSGHGTCEFIEEMAADTDKRVGGTAGVVYTSWDQEKIVGCKCDANYEGHDCNSRMCPKGDDPLTSSQSDMKQVILLKDVTAFYLTYYDPYGESWTTGSITSTAGLTGDATVCPLIQTALRRLPNHALSDVSVSYFSANVYSYARTAGVDATIAGAADSGAGATTDQTGAGYTDAANIICQVTFPSAAGTTGLQHLLGCSAASRTTVGSQPLVSGGGLACDVFEVSPATGTVVHKLTELATCSNRGLCDSSTGSCTCFPGHKGAACEKQEALV